MSSHPFTCAQQVCTSNAASRLCVTHKRFDTQHHGTTLRVTIYCRTAFFPDTYIPKWLKHSVQPVCMLKLKAHQ